MKTWLLLFVLLPFAAIAGANDSAESASSQVTVDIYQLRLPLSWDAQVYKPPEQLIVALRKKDGKPVGEILASRLLKSVDIESTEMANSVQRNPEAMALLDAGDFSTTSNVKGKKIALAIRASDPNFGRPLVFYSIYLPRDDGGSVTFKLRCGAAEFKTLRAEFEAIIATAVAGKAKD